MADNALEWLSGEALDDVESLADAALVVFTTSWCPPCKTLMPRLERLVGRHQARLHCYLVDIDRHPEPAQKYGVRGIPTLMLFLNGDLEGTRVGALEDEQLESFVASSL